MIAQGRKERNTCSTKPVRLAKKTFPISLFPKEEVRHYRIAGENYGIDLSIVFEDVIYHFPVNGLLCVIAEAPRSRPGVAIGHNRQSRNLRGPGYGLCYSSLRVMTTTCQ